MISAESFIILVSSTLLLCYVSGLFYSKTKIPDVIWLLAFGVLLGPVFGYFNKESFTYILPLMSVVAVCIITFDSALGLDLTLVMRSMLKATALAVFTFTAIVLSAGYLLSLIMAGYFNLLEGMLLGTMVAGISTVAISSILDGLQRVVPNMESTSALLNVETTVADPIRLIAAITLIRMIMQPGASIYDSVKEIVYTFAVALAMGLFLSLAWAEVLDKLRGRSLNYILTLAALFPIYFLVEGIAGPGGGTIAVFTLGIVIANYRHVVRRLGIKRSLRPDKQRIVEFNKEIAFLLKSYYFVYIGLIVSLSSRYVLFGLFIVVLVLIIRYAIATLVGRLLKFSMEELVFSRLMFALGTSTLVMSQFPSLFDKTGLFFLHQDVYSDLCFSVLLGTVIYTAVVSPIIARRQLRR